MINYFQLSWGIELKAAFAIICLTILVHVYLLFAIVVTGNIKKSHSFLEVARGLAESLMLLSIAVQASKNMYNTTEAQKAIPGFVAIWFSSLMSTYLGLMKSFTGFLRFTDKPSFSRLQWLIITIVWAAFIMATFVVLCVLYVANVLAFVIFICFLYYNPFITIAFAIVTIIIARIAWVFFRPVFMEVRLENVPGIL